MITIEPPRAKSGAGLGKAGIARFLGRARAAVGLKGEVHVLLADDRTLRRLNRQFRGKDKATDVLSFPAAASTAFAGEQRLAGDLAISLDMAARQAKRYGHTLADEVRVLVLHGLLHLAGYDHERDKGEMAAREQELRAILKLPGGLIERVVGVPSNQRQKTNTGVLRSAQDDGFTGDAERCAQDDGKKRAARAPAARKRVRA